MSKTAVAAALRLTRPAQWPILTIQLMVGMLLAVPVGTPDGVRWWTGLPWWRLVSAWLAWVVLLNGGTLAFNSAYDRDTGPVAYLAQPPPPPTWLARAALGMMILGAGLAWFLVGGFSAVLIGGCVILSVLYSHPVTRWKSRPGLDLLTNMIGYGAGTTWAGLSAVKGGVPDATGWWFGAGFGLLFGSFYPLTQIYQTEADRRRGDRTLTTALGIRPSLGLALGLGLAATAALGQGCATAHRTGSLGLLLLACGLWSGNLVWWWARAGRWRDADHERGMYRALALWAGFDLALAVVWLRG